MFFDVDLFLISYFKGRKVECLIEGNGEKTVIIMSGMGGSIYEWMDIADEVSQYAKVIVIHRPALEIVNLILKEAIHL